MIEAVIFDLDGTLIDLPMNYESLFAEIRRIMKVKNVRPLLKTVTKANEQQKKEIFTEWDRIELEALSKMTLKDAGIAIYRQYSEKPRILVTMQGRKLVKAVLERFALSFKTAVTREDSLDRVKHLMIALRSLELKPQNVLFVGNEDHDQAAAKEVGCQFRRVESESLV